MFCWITVALTVEKDPPRELSFRYIPHTIGHFGHPLDSFASACASNPKDPLSTHDSDSHSIYMLPSDMFDDNMVHIDCILSIKTMIDDMQSQNKAAHQLLQDIIARLGPTLAENVHHPS